MAKWQLDDTQEITVTDEDGDTATVVIRRFNEGDNQDFYSEISSQVQVNEEGDVERHVDAGRFRAFYLTHGIVSWTIPVKLCVENIRKLPTGVADQIHSAVEDLNADFFGGDESPLEESAGKSTKKNSPSKPKQ